MAAHERAPGELGNGDKSFFNCASCDLYRGEGYAGSESEEVVASGNNWLD